jgi:hypothetical protein
MVEFELRNYAESVRYLENALACNVRALEGNLREDAQSLLRRARANVGQVTVEVAPAASIQVDGAKVSEGSEAKLLLRVGTHELTVEAQGFEPETRTLTIRGGDQRKLHIALSPSLPEESARPLPLFAHDDAAQATPDELPTRKPRLARKWWLWTLVGAGVAAAVTGLTLSLRSKDAGEREPMTTPHQQVDGSLHALWQLP